MTQPRAKPGGEIGANGEWYEGGKFIATTDHAKSAGKGRKATGRQEIEPYKWDVPPEPGMRSIWQAMSPGVFTGKLPDGRMGLNPHTSEHTWLYYNDNDPALVEQAKARYQALADRFNAGERWFKESPMCDQANVALGEGETKSSEEAMKLDTTINPDDPNIYQVVATVHDPRTDEGEEDEAVNEHVNQSRVRAIQYAEQWAKDGYWTSVYNQRSGECVFDSAPKEARAEASDDMDDECRGFRP